MDWDCLLDQSNLDLRSKQLVKSLFLAIQATTLADHACTLTNGLTSKLLENIRDPLERRRLQTLDRLLPAANSHTSVTIRKSRNAERKKIAVARSINR